MIFIFFPQKCFSCNVTCGKQSNVFLLNQYSLYYKKLNVCLVYKVSIYVPQVRNKDVPSEIVFSQSAFATVMNNNLKAITFLWQWL